VKSLEMLYLVPSQEETLATQPGLSQLSDLTPGRPSGLSAHTKCYLQAEEKESPIIS
jgi:hypothetical protein